MPWASQAVSDHGVVLASRRTSTGGDGGREPFPVLTGSGGGVVYDENTPHAVTGVVDPHYLFRPPLISQNPDIRFSHRHPTFRIYVDDINSRQ